MEAHFLEGILGNRPSFSPEPWYNPYGDCLVCQTANEAVVADRVDEVLTIYRSGIDNRPIGFQVKGISALIRTFGLDGLSVQSESEAGEITSVSVYALLLAAYERGPRTVRRRQAYTCALESGPFRDRIERRDLQPA
jgi:hypothetical protein